MAFGNWKKPLFGELGMGERGDVFFYYYTTRWRHETIGLWPSIIPTLRVTRRRDGKLAFFLNILGSNFMPGSNGGRGAGFEENVIYAPQVFGCCCSLDTRQFNTSSQFGLKGQPPQKVNFCSTLTAGRHTSWQDFDRHSLLTNSSCYWPRGNLPWWRIIWSVRRVSRARSQRPTVWTQRLKKPAVTCSATRVNWNGFVVSYKTLT